MRILLAGLSIVILSLFIASAPASAENGDLVVLTTPADAPSDATDAPECTVDEEVSTSDANDLELTDEEISEMACLPRYAPCSSGSQCCSGYCRRFSGGGGGAGSAPYICQ